MYSGGFSEPAEYATGRQGAETAWKREGQREIQGGNVTERISDLHHIVISSTFFFLLCHVCSSQNREPLMPSPQFIKSYFSSFTDDIISQPLQKGEKKDEDKDKEGEASEVTGR